ncbi:MAG: DUF998 domain-containing protein [Bacteroidota bacterium]
MKYFIKQATLIPFLFLIPVFVAGFLTEDYDPIKQHGSEITLTDFGAAKLILSSGAISAGLSCIVLAMGILLNFKKYHLSSILLTIFGISMISNGLYPMGTPMHGLYGIGLSFMLLPFAACYELKTENVRNRFFSISIMAGFIVFIYFWAMLVGLDPTDYRGVTQRVASIFIFGWIAFFAFELNKKL